MPMSSIVGSDMLSVLIVGCGNIAGGYDSSVANSEREGYLTHASAYLRHGGFKLAACVDTDESTLVRFRARWGVQNAYTSLLEALEENPQLDVVSICTPTCEHSNNLRQVLSARPRLVFCEKPIAPNLIEASSLVNAYQVAGIPLAVNYTRRWDPDIRALKAALEDGTWGMVRTAVAYYGKGVLNNASHMVDLLHFLLGPLKLMSIGTPVWDHWEDDPTVPALLETAGGVSVHLVATDARDYSLAELQLVTERGIITLEESGFSWRERKVCVSEHFPGYRVVAEATQRHGRLGLAMLNAVSNIFYAISNGSILASTGNTALLTQEVCQQIRDRAVASQNTERPL
jgi:predicted dehydrogenase